MPERMITQTKEWKPMSFIVRFYPALPEGPEDWRGQVEHVQTGEKRPFRGALQLMQIMESFFEPAAKEPNIKEVRS